VHVVVFYVTSKWLNLAGCYSCLLVSSDAQAVPNAAFGQGTGRILLDDVACAGNELRLLDCAHSTIGDHSCGHHEDAGVRCQQLHSKPQSHA